LSSEAKENLESLNIKVDPFVSGYLDKAKSEGSSKRGVLFEALVVFKWFNNRASYKITRETVLSREVLKAVRTDMVQKGADNVLLLKLDDTILAVDNFLRRLEVEGEGKANGK
jgi:hypothetical protein